LQDQSAKVRSKADEDGSVAEALFDPKKPLRKEDAEVKAGVTVGDARFLVLVLRVRAAALLVLFSGAARARIVTPDLGGSAHNLLDRL